MRSFIAIELPQNIKDYLSRLQTQLKNSQADVKWVEPQNIHLTLKFLGEIDDNQLSEINNILENIAKERKHFQANVSSAGAFPKINFPRVIWVGLKEGDQETQDIARYLEEKIAGMMEKGLITKQQADDLHELVTVPVAPSGIAYTRGV